jgi:hypothetical protein
MDKIADGAKEGLMSLASNPLTGLKVAKDTAKSILKVKNVIETLISQIKDVPVELKKLIAAF